MNTNTTTARNVVADMNGKTLDALTRSIAKWEANANVHNIDDAKLGTGQCPLCQLFYHHGCNGCPVFVETGQDCCNGTPYDAAHSAYCAALDNNGDLSTFHTAATAERDFLKSLIPHKPIEGDTP